MPNFNHTTRTLFKNLLAKRLGDTSLSYWTDAEFNVYINEALRTFGAMFQSWKEDIVLILSNPTVFYDITTEAQDTSRIEFSTTYQELLDSINLHLLESLSVGNPASELTSVDEVLKFARNRVNAFLHRTSLIVYRSVKDMPIPPLNKLVVPDSFLDIVRVAFTDPTELGELDNAVYRVLRKEDELSISYSRTEAFNTKSFFPEFYTTVLESLNEIKIYPLPDVLGKLEIISVNGLDSTIAIDLNSIVPLPNNLTPFIKWGILADIYAKDGIGFIPENAAFCEQLFEEGIEVGKLYTSILWATLNAKPINTDSIKSLDSHDNNWQNKVSRPFLIGIAGFNLIAANRIPDDFYNLTITVNANAYLPANDADVIDVKPEYIQTLLDYCVFLANVKNGPAGIKLTNGLRTAFIKSALNYNIRLMQRSQTFRNMMSKTKVQEMDEERIPENVGS